jgi:hypothetical protein
MRRGNPIGRWEGVSRAACREQGRDSVPELVEVYGAGAVGVKHPALVSLCVWQTNEPALPDHHAHGMRVERAPVTIHKRSPQLSLSQNPTAVPVNSAEQLPQRISIIRVPWRRRRRRRPLLLCDRGSAMETLRWGAVAVVRWRGAAHAVSGPRVVS